MAEILKVLPCLGLLPLSSGSKRRKLRCLVRIVIGERESEVEKKKKKKAERKRGRKKIKEERENRFGSLAL